MNLIYIDESGNTGKNLSDIAQPLFVLGALIIPEKKWMLLEGELEQKIQEFFPAPRPPKFEIHANETINSRGYFRPFKLQHRLDFISHWISCARTHNLRFIYRAIEKKRYALWLNRTFGPGVTVHPHVAAFALVAQVVNDLLKSENELGIFISDENKEVMHDVEKSIRVLRGDAGPLRLSHIIEKGFFIQSINCLPLQLCDVCTYAARRLEESKRGIAPKPYEQPLMEMIESLIHRGKESFADVIEWLEKSQKE